VTRNANGLAGAETVTLLRNQLFTVETVSELHDWVAHCDCPEKLLDKHIHWRARRLAPVRPTKETLRPGARKSSAGHAHSCIGTSKSVKLFDYYWDVSWRQNRPRDEMDTDNGKVNFIVFGIRFRSLFGIQT
jgi:hypothetical protein